MKVLVWVLIAVGAVMVVIAYTAGWKVGLPVTIGLLAAWLILATLAFGGRKK
jgi:hypothetical protein